MSRTLERYLGLQSKQPESTMLCNAACPAFWGLIAILGITAAVKLVPTSETAVVRTLAEFFSGIGNIGFLVLGYLGIILYSMQKRAWLNIRIIFATLLVVTLVVHLQKDIFGAWLTRPSGGLGGFPSGHAAAACALAFLIAMFIPRWSVLGYLMAVGISWSRVPLAAHWPYQVVAGAITGYLLAFVITDHLAHRARHHALIFTNQHLLAFSIPIIALCYGHHEYENDSVVVLGTALLILTGVLMRLLVARALAAGTPDARAEMRHRQTRYCANILIFAGVTLGAEMPWLIPLGVLTGFVIYTLAEREQFARAHAGYTATTGEFAPSPTPWRRRFPPVQYAWIYEMAWVLLIIPIVLKELIL